jgi:hypothetical protein
VFKPVVMKMFVIKCQSGEYLTKLRMSSNYLDYERTIHKAAAERLNDFDSKPCSEETGKSRPEECR